jgi:transposase
MRFDLSDEEWALLEPLLPKSRKSGRVDDRKIMNAILCCARGCRGAICLNGMVRTQRHTIASIVGRDEVSGNEFSIGWQCDRATVSI